MMLEIAVAAESETDELGRQLAEAAEPRLVVALVGELGAGKTRFARSVAVALGADAERVNSPTFVLIQHYEARLPIFHFDTYRLRDADEFADLGPEEFFEAGGVCLVEWADRVTDLLPDDRLTVEITVTGASTRLIRLSATGPMTRAVLDRISAAIACETD